MNLSIPHHLVEERIDKTLMGLSSSIIQPVQVCKVADDNLCCGCEQALVLKWDLFANECIPSDFLCMVNKSIMQLYKKCLSEGHKDYQFRVYDISVRYSSNMTVIAVRFYLNVSEDGNLSDGREASYWDWDFSNRKSYMVYPNKGGYRV